VEELPGGANLTEDVQQALRDSARLIVICSPRAAGSPWVDKEVVYFRGLGRGAAIHALLVEGEPAQAFPPALRDVVEPTAADVRGLNRLWWWRLRVPLMKLLAPILGCEFDDLQRRARARTQRKMRVAAAAGLVLIMAAAAGLRWFTARRIGELVSHSENLLTQDPALGVVLSRAAFERSRSGWLSADEPRRALERALGASRLRAQFHTGQGWVGGLAWRDDGVLVASGLGRSILVMNTRDWSSRTVEVGGHRGTHRMTFNPAEPALVALVGPSRLLTRFNLNSGWQETWGTGTQAVNNQMSDVSWCSNGRYLATSNGTGTVVVFDLVNPDNERLYKGSQWNYANAIAWNDRCDVLAVGGWLGVFTLRVGDERRARNGFADRNAPLEKDGTITKIGEHPTDAVNATQLRPEGALDVAWSPSEEQIATAGQDGTVRIWSLRDHDSAPDILTGHGGEVTSIAWRPSGGELVSASGDGTIRFWYLPDHARIYQSIVIPTNQDTPLNAVWSPDGQSVASGGSDGTVKIWRIAIQDERASIGGREREISYDRDARVLLDDTPATDDELLELARQRSVRTLTAEECRTYFYDAACTPFDGFAELRTAR
jgi:WD40 repeat protein